VKHFLPVGTHILADFYGVNAALLSDQEALEWLIRDAATKSGATILSSHMHRFGVGMGVTGVVMLAESHISIHTWPEHQMAAIDIYLCGEAVAKLALEVLRENLVPASEQVQQVARGMRDGITREYRLF
jgi:S-adenosylmethionine decarboxylase